jgi:hypothetical protein
LEIDRFGESVGIDGDTSIVGAPFDDVVNVGTDAGSAYIFIRNGSVWTEQRKIIPTDSFVNSFFGNSVAINGSDVAIASTAAGSLRRGFLYVYRRFGTEWRSRQQVASPTAGHVGVSAAISDEFIASAGSSGLTAPGLQTVVFKLITGVSSFDYEADGRTDLSLWRPSNGTWYIARSSDSGMSVFPWGLNGDKIVPADYDGDGKTDFAVRRPSDNNFYIFNSSNSTMNVTGWGITGDVAVPSDYDSDGRADIAVWRPSDGSWYLALTSNGTMYVQPWGTNGDVPAPGDFDGDGRSDLCVFRPSDGKWYSFTIANRGISITAWGLNGDKPVPGDYSGDGKTDFAVFRPSDNTWHRLHSNDGSVHSTTWGLAGDFPAPGDYDGDGRVDIAVWRPSDSTWYILRSSSGFFTQTFGTSGDTPTPNAFVY